MDRKNYKEKMDNNLEPMEAVQHIGTIEATFFTNGIGNTSGLCVIHANLRDRFTFLATTTMCGLVPVPGVAFLYPARKNSFEYFSLNTRYRVGLNRWASILRLNVDLSNSFLNILLANNTVHGVVGLGY